MTEQIDILARVIIPEAFADDAEDMVDDVPVARAEAHLYASRVVGWLAAHDAEVARRAVAAYQLAASNALLALLPPNPHTEPSERESS